MRRMQLQRDSVRRDGGSGADVATAADPPTQIDVGDPQVLGVSPFAAHADHQHACPGGVAPPAVAAASAVGVATTPARSDHTHQGVATIDAAGGAFTTGSIAPMQVDIGDASSLGTAGTIARADHQHPVPASAVVPPAVAAAGSVGVATTPARSDHTHAGVATVEGAAGAITIVSPMKSVAGGVVTLANGNNKNLPGGFVTNDIDTDANTAFKIAKLTGAVVVPVPKVPTGNIEDRRITFTVISRGTPADTVTWTTGANGFSWATQLGPLQADFDSLLAAAPNNAVIKWA
jgi:hypothetical protein